MDMEVKKDMDAEVKKDMRGCFKVELEDNKIINCTPLVNDEDIPKEQEKLYLAVESTQSIINSIRNIDTESNTDYIKSLFDIASAGLSRETYQVNPKLALKSLEKLKDEILLKERSRIKNSYMKLLGIWSLIYILILLFVNDLVKNSYPNIPRYVYVCIGSILGTWVSFGARKYNLSFKELSIIENDNVNPPIRLIFISLCSIIVMLFLQTEIVNISIGNKGPQSINESVEIQMSLGVIIGLVEYKVSKKLFTKANSVMDKMLKETT